MSLYFTRFTSLIKSSTTVASCLAAVHSTVWEGLGGVEVTDFRGFLSHLRSCLSFLDVTVPQNLQAPWRGSSMSSFSFSLDTKNLKHAFIIYVLKDSGRTAAIFLDVAKLYWWAIGIIVGPFWPLFKGLSESL